MDHPVIIKYGRIRDDGDSGEQFIRVKFPRKWTKQQRHEWSHRKFTRRCSHSYDCCGNWYAYVLTFKLRHDKRSEWIVPVQWYRNV